MSAGAALDPEARARQDIDAALLASGWVDHAFKAVNLYSVPA